LTTVVILQSNYIPWRGYFDLIRKADHFVIYDCVQFTKNDWRNRNRIVAPGGPQWLSAPVRTSGRFGEAIDQVDIAPGPWARKHLSALRSALGRAPHFSVMAPTLENWFAEAATLGRLSAVNRLFIQGVMAQLGLDTPLHDARDLVSGEGRTERLISICRRLGATRYLSGPAAQTYLDVAAFEAAGIAVDWMRYPEYPAYRQADGGYTPGVSILDTLAHLAPEAVFGDGER
jgi:hypothetical protein